MSYREVNYCSCGNICEGTTKYCASCNFENRKLARQARKTKVVVAVKKITAKRAAETVNYIKLKREYLEAYPCCEVQDCHLKSVDVHHKSGRANDDLTNADDFMAVCRGHHERITADTKWAKENGYSYDRTV